jgi:hypothetical protein
MPRTAAKFKTALIALALVVSGGAISARAENAFECSHTAILRYIASSSELAAEIGKAAFASCANLWTPYIDAECSRLWREADPPMPSIRRPQWLNVCARDYTSTITEALTAYVFEARANAAGK